MSDVFKSTSVYTGVNSTAGSKQVRSSLSLITTDRQHPARRQVETFIANGFATHYNAHICSFMPVLIALEVNGVKAAVGARCAFESHATHPLFIEQYLTVPVEKALLEVGITVSRQEIAEVGNLFSSASRYTLPLLLSLFILLKNSGTEYLVFSATAKLQKMLDAAALPLVTLADADKAKLMSKGDNWGSYYETTPKVMSLSLRDVTRHVTANGPLHSYYQQAMALIASSVNELPHFGVIRGKQNEAPYVA